MRRGAFDLRGDRLQHTGEVAHHVAVPEADYAPAPRLQHAGARGVFRDGARMLAAVDLDDELAGRNGEIREMPPDGVLTPDPGREGRRAQRPPQDFLGLRRVPAQPPRAVCPGFDHATDLPDVLLTLNSRGLALKPTSP